MGHQCTARGTCCVARRLSSHSTPTMCKMGKTRAFHFKEAPPQNSIVWLLLFDFLRLKNVKRGKRKIQQSSEQVMLFHAGHELHGMRVLHSHIGRATMSVLVSGKRRSCTAAAAASAHVLSAVKHMIRGAVSYTVATGWAGVRPQRGCFEKARQFCFMSTWCPLQASRVVNKGHAGWGCHAHQNHHLSFRGIQAAPSVGPCHNVGCDVCVKGH